MPLGKGLMDLKKEVGWRKEWLFWGDRWKGLVFTEGLINSSKQADSTSALTITLAMIKSFFY